MKIQTARFGEIEVDKEFVFDFVEPILGYEHLKQFVLIDHNSDSAFKWLQSIDDLSIAFPVSFPKLFGIDYEFIIPEKEAQAIELYTADDLLAFNIISIPQGKPADATINLSAPVIINLKTKKAMQLVLLEANYPVRQKLFSNAVKVEAKNEAEISTDESYSSNKVQEQEESSKDSSPVK